MEEESLLEVMGIPVVSADTYIIVAIVVGQHNQVPIGGQLDVRISYRNVCYKDYNTHQTQYAYI